MKLVKNILAVALCSVLATPVMAASDKASDAVTIYGKVNLTAQSSDKGEGSFSEVKSNSSRLGFKGTYKLDDGLSVIYKAEFGVDMSGTKSTNVTARSQYLGVKGGFGTVLIGKNDTMLKQSEGKIDLFNYLNADISTLWVGQNRLGNTLTYKAPKFAGIQVGATYILEGSYGGTDGFSIAAIYGDKKLKKSKFYAAVAMDSDVKGKSKDGTAGSGYYDTVRLTAYGKVGGIVLGAMYQTQEETTTGASMDGYFLNAKYKVGKTTLKVQYQAADHSNIATINGTTNSGISVGADYKLGKNTQVFAFYSTFDLETSDKAQDYLGLGLKYKF